MKANNRILLSAMMVLMAFSIRAQQSVPHDIPSPNAATLGLYGSIPMSYHTGTPGISIPLHTLNERGVELPVSLDYDASGVKLNALPSWTGYNWSLSAGGVITRSIHGQADEFVYPIQANLGAFRNYFKAYNQVLSICTYGGTLSYYAYYHTVDTEPDVFYFNFMGRCGRFFLGHDGNWKVVSNDNIEVLYNVSDTTQLIAPFIDKYPDEAAVDRNQPLTIPGFKLRDEAGTVYEFGYTTNAIEYTIDMRGTGTNEDVVSWLASAWYLTRVTDRLGNVLYTLQYERGPYIMQFYDQAEMTSFKESVGSGWLHTISEGGYCNYTFSGNEEENPLMHYGAQLNSPVYLTQIACASGNKVSVTSSFNPTALHDLYNGLYSGGKTSQLYYYLMHRLFKYKAQNQAFAYFPNDVDTANCVQYCAPNYNHYDLLSYCRLRKVDRVSFSNLDTGSQFWYDFYYTTGQRMMLNRLARLHYSNNGNDVVDSRHDFRYNDLAQLPIDCMTDKTDHWGYFNNVASTLPTSEQGARAYGLTKQPDTTACKYGTLSEIQWPTGGVTHIDYQPNEFSACVLPNQSALLDTAGHGGGVRVWRISVYEDSTHSMLLGRRTFTYTKPGSSMSSGQLNARPQYFWPEWQSKTLNPNATSLLTTFRSMSIVPLSNSFGPSVGYTNVEEHVAGHGFTRYTFSDNTPEGNRDFLIVSSGLNDGNPTPYDVYTERGYLRGRLLNTSMFDEDGIKVRSIQNNWRTSSCETDPVYGSSIFSKKNFISGAVIDMYYDVATENFRYWPGRVYKLFHLKYDLASTSDTTFFDNGVTAVETRIYDRQDRVLTMTSPYNHNVTVRALLGEQRTRGSHTEQTEYVLPFASASTTDNELASRYHCLYPVATHRYYDGAFVSGDSTAYSSFTISQDNQQLMPIRDIRLYPAANDTIVDITSYTSTGRVSFFNHIATAGNQLTWTGNDNLLTIWCRYGPLINNVQLGAYNPRLASSMASLMLDLIAIDQPSLITVYSHNPLAGVNGIFNNNGTGRIYQYDRQMRLAGISDQSNLLLLKYMYNYQNK